ncbi:peroxidase C1A-like isoform X2 [Brassica rapa]|uniref:peroxidase C1A-like isoform X2 n=1 Tax=Brassica campestris TaxID=3711 RepID=UPI0004F15E76|nr:peroxidase C1A-like isoform X2 [Brassica rapa]
MHSSYSFSTSSTLTILNILACLVLSASLSDAQLTPTFYDTSCPNVTNIVRDTIVDELRSDPRIAASILRLHFHDCFVNAGGPSWRVPLGRRDSLQAFFDLANVSLPPPFLTLPQLKAMFINVGLDRPSDLVALSGGHTFGKNQCLFIMDRLYNFNKTGLPDPTFNTTYLQTVRGLCPLNGNLRALVDLDLRTPTVFDNKYYVNLKEQKGLVQTDQELFSSSNATDTIPLVKAYADDTQTFFNAFVEAMKRMGNIKPLTGTEGEIRLNCRVVNSNSRLHDAVEIVDFVSM